MTIHATFAKKLARLQNRDDRFLALFGHDGQLDLSVLNVKHGVRDVALQKPRPMGIKGRGQSGSRRFRIKRLGLLESGVQRTLPKWTGRSQPETDIA